MDQRCHQSAGRISCLAAALASLAVDDAVAAEGDGGGEEEDNGPLVVAAAGVVGCSNSRLAVVHPVQVVAWQPWDRDGSLPAVAVLVGDAEDNIGVSGVDGGEHLEELALGKQILERA